MCRKAGTDVPPKYPMCSGDRAGPCPAASYCSYLTCSEMSAWRVDSSIDLIGQVYEGSLFALFVAAPALACPRSVLTVSSSVPPVFLIDRGHGRRGRCWPFTYRQSDGDRAACGMNIDGDPKVSALVVSGPRGGPTPGRDCSISPSRATWIRPCPVILGPTASH